MNFMLPVMGVVLRQFYLIRGSFPRFIQLFIWVAVDMVLWGFTTRYLNEIASPGYNFVTVLLGGLLLWNIMIRIMQGTTLAYMEDSWSRNIFNIFVSPISIGQYLAGLIFSSIMTSLVGIAVMIMLASGVFGFSLFSYGISLLPFMMILFLFGMALGIFGCALMMRMGPSAEWLVWPLPFVISPFAGVFYPLSSLPAWMQGVAEIMPVSYVFENIRLISQGGALSVPDMMTGLALAAIYIVLSCLFFIQVYRRALKTGSIARFSAESF